MKLGIRGHDLGKFPNSYELAKKAKENGFQAVQLVLHKALENVTGAPGTLTKEFAEKVYQDFSNNDVEVLMLGAYFNIVDGKKAQKDIDKFKEHLRYAKNFGCSLVGSETGSFLSGRVHCEETKTEKSYQTVLATVKELVDVASESSVNVAIEGAWYHVISDCKKLKRLIDDISSPNLKVIFDLYNLVNIDNYQSQRQIIDEAFSLYGDKIVLIHAKDFCVENNNLKQVSLGKGIYDYPYLINRMKMGNYDIPIIFEGITGSDIQTSYEYIMNIINR